MVLEELCPRFGSGDIVVVSFVDCGDFVEEALYELLWCFFACLHSLGRHGGLFCSSFSKLLNRKLIFQLID